MSSDYREAPDAELLTASASGDEDAFRELYRRHRRSIYGFALHTTGRTAMAEDITQDVFLSLLRPQVTYDPERGSLRSYLYGIARHVVRSYLREDRPYVSIDTEEPLPPTADSDGPFDALAREDQLRRLHEAILALPSLYRDVVVMCHLHGLSYGEAAQAFGCTEGTVASRLNRARALLARKLKAICLT